MDKEAERNSDKRNFMLNIGGKFYKPETLGIKKNNKKRKKIDLSFLHS